MKQWGKIVIVATTIILAPLWYNSAALAQNVLAGVDLWETRPGDASHEFGGGTDCPPIPADFFGPGSDPFDGIIYFQGQPLQTIPAGTLGSTDTIVERLTDAELPSCPSFDTVDIEIVALNLVSTEPITVTYGGMEDPDYWDVQMCLSSAVPQGTGIMTISQNCSAGGTFTAELPLLPKFIFTKVGEPSTQWTIDYGSWGIGPVYYAVTDGHWLYSDHGFHVITSPGGLLVDHDCDGTSDVAVGSSSNFYPGLKATPCNSCPGLAPTYSMVLTLWQSVDCGLQEVYPPQSDEPIPTLSEWGIIIFMTVMLGIGVVMILRRRRMV